MPAGYGTREPERHQCPGRFHMGLQDCSHTFLCELSGRNAQRAGSPRSDAVKWKEITSDAAKSLILPPQRFLVVRYFHVGVLGAVTTQPFVSS